MEDRTQKRGGTFGKKGPGAATMATLQMLASPAGPLLIRAASRHMSAVSPKPLAPETSGQEHGGRSGGELEPGPIWLDLSHLTQSRDMSCIVGGSQPDVTKTIL